jgi:hypothetical protein
MTRIHTLVVLLVTLALTTTNGLPMQGPHGKMITPSPSPERFINLLGQRVIVSPPGVHEKVHEKMPDPPGSFRLFKAVIAPPIQPSSAGLIKHSPVDEHQSTLQEKQFRLFGVNHDIVPPQSGAAVNIKVEQGVSPPEKTASPPRQSHTPSPPPPASASPVDAPQASKKDKEVVIQAEPSPESAATTLQTADKDKATERASNKKRKGKAVATEHSPWTTPATKKRTRISSGNKSGGKKSRAISNLMHETVAMMPQVQQRKGEKVNINKVAGSELFASHKFRVIDPALEVDHVMKKVVPFDPEAHGTYHQYGHPENLEDYRLAADKMVKEDDMSKEERIQLDHNLVKSNTAIDGMMKKKPGTAIYHATKNVIFQNPGSGTTDERVTQRQVKKALKKFQDGKLRRLILKDNEYLSFKKPRMDRYKNRFVPAAQLDLAKMTDPEKAHRMQAHNERVAINRPGYEKTSDDPSSSEGEWMSSPSSSSSSSG